MAGDSAADLTQGQREAPEAGTAGCGGQSSATAPLMLACVVRQAVVFIALMDADYVHSPSCAAEFAHAVSASIYILPVILPGYRKPDSRNWWPADAKVRAAWRQRGARVA